MIFEGFEHKICVSIFCTIFTLNIFILERVQRDIIMRLNAHRYAHKVPVILVRY